LHIFRFIRLTIFGVKEWQILESYTYIWSIYFVSTLKSYIIGGQSTLGNNFHEAQFSQGQAFCELFCCPTNSALYLGWHYYFSHAPIEIKKIFVERSFGFFILKLKKK